MNPKGLAFLGVFSAWKMQRKRQEEGICFEEFAGKVGRGYSDKSIGLGRQQTTWGLSLYLGWLPLPGVQTHRTLSVVSSAYNFITSFFPSSLADWGDLFVDTIFVGEFSFGCDFFFQNAKHCGRGYLPYEVVSTRLMIF